MEIKELKPENVEVGDLYLAPPGEQYENLSKRIRPAEIISVTKNDFLYSSINRVFSSRDSFNHPQGILVKRTPKGNLELHVSKEVLEAIKDIMPIRKRGY